ncbi:MAG: nucleoside/nucleotide kinase family protein [Clostridia bacterium]|nr:nucleoside/nucleotide kinase family protein [Clostridia bacterium]
MQINGIEVDARYTEETVEEVFLPLLRSLTELQREKGRRILVLLAAPPGCGKTTLAAFLEEMSRSREGLCPVQAIGMDGFHRYQDFLLSHTALVDGEEVQMVRIKGAPVTFDLEKLRAAVVRVAAGEACSWPVYDRMTHNPREDALLVDAQIVLLEGNYLLLLEDGWRELAEYADYTISLTADEALLRERLIKRKKKTCRDEEEAVRFVDFSDMRNVRLCQERSRMADLRLQISERGGRVHCAAARNSVKGEAAKHDL